MTITLTDGFATEALAWNRTRTISLGIGQIAADEAAEKPTSETRSIRDCPLLTVANCTLIARRPSAFQAWHIPGRGEICERPALLSIAGAGRRLPPLLSAVRAWPARPANQIPAARHAGRSWLGRERLPATSRAVGGKPESAAVPGAGQPRKLGQIGIAGTLRLVRDAGLNGGHTGASAEVSPVSLGDFGER